MQKFRTREDKSSGVIFTPSACDVPARVLAADGVEILVGRTKRNPSPLGTDFSQWTRGVFFSPSARTSSQATGRGIALIKNTVDAKIFFDGNNKKY
jgi:hypothetical protein